MNRLEREAIERRAEAWMDEVDKYLTIGAVAFLVVIFIVWARQHGLLP